MYEIYGLQQLGRAATYQDWRDCVHPDDIDHVEAQLQATVRGEATFNVEFRSLEERWPPALGPGHGPDTTGIARACPSAWLALTWTLPSVKNRRTAPQSVPSSFPGCTGWPDRGFGVGTWTSNYCGMNNSAKYMDYSTRNRSCSLAGMAQHGFITKDIERVEARLRATLAGAPYAGVEISHLAHRWRTAVAPNPLPRYSEMTRATPCKWWGLIKTLLSANFSRTNPRSQRNRFRRVFCLHRCGDQCLPIFSGLVLDANERFLNLLGYTQTELKARMINWVNLTPPEHRGSGS